MDDPKPLDYGKALGGLAVVLAIPVIFWIAIVYLKNR
jgi:hypothetical protein